MLQLHYVRYDHPDAQSLTELVQLTYVEMYGSRDDSPIGADDFAPPCGAFLVGYLDEIPVAMGGWRFSGFDITDRSRPAEVKRMFVRDEFRRRGLARDVLTALETSAKEAGADVIILETGQPQLAATALYRGSGYFPVTPFGHYKNSGVSISLAKPL